MFHMVTHRYTKSFSPCEVETDGKLKIFLYVYNKRSFSLRTSFTNYIHIKFKITQQHKTSIFTFNNQFTIKKL